MCFIAFISNATMNRFLFQVVVSNSPSGPFTANFCICQGGTVYFKNVSTYNTGPGSDPCLSNNANSIGLEGLVYINTWTPNLTYAIFDCTTAPGGTWNYGEVVSATLINAPLSGGISMSCGWGKNVYFEYSEAYPSETSPLCGDPNFYHDMVYGYTYPVATADAGSDVTICAGQSVNLTAGGVGTPNWSGPDGTCNNCPTYPVNPTTTSTYTLTTSTTTCPSSATDQVTVFVNGDINLGSDLVLCYNQTYTIDAGGGYDSYVWSQPAPGNCLYGGQLMTACNPGTYCLTITEAGCENTDCIDVSFVDCTPCDIRPGFSMLQEINDCATIHFFDGSVPNVYTTVVGYSWNFGDGTTSTEQNPVHTFYYNGNYTVTLTVFGIDDEGNCCSASYRETITISCACNPENLYVTMNNDGCTYSFFESSATSGTSHLISWQWDFGDGTLGIGQNVVHTYEANGTYTVTLTATAFNGEECCSVHPEIFTVIVNCDQERCDVEAEFNYTVDYGYADFFDQSVIGTGTNVIAYIWDFGDGQTSDEQNPEHTYYSVGSYDVCLTVIGIVGNDCCADVICHKVQITEISELQGGGGGNRMQQSDPEKSPAAWLGQNNPNPFDEVTTINSYIPDGTGSAVLNIYSDKGELINSIKLDQRGLVSRTISLTNLEPGVYHYNLLLDGVQFNRKKMAIIR